MRRYLIYITYLTIILSSCGAYAHWEQFPAQGLPEKDERYEAMVFIDSLTGYLGGARTILIGQITNQYELDNRTVLYKTIDRGKSWLKIPLDYRGSVDRIIPFGDTLVVLLQDVTSDSVYIFKSENNGRDWKHLFSVSSSVYIRAIHFAQPDNGYLVTDDGNQSFVLKFHHNKWDTILSVPNSRYHYKIIQNTLLSLIPEQTTANSKGVTITDITTGKSNELFFDKPYFIASSTSNEKNLYLAASDHKTGKILEVSDTGIKVIGFGNYSDYDPDQLFVYNNTIMVIANRQKDVAPLGVIYSLLISKDNGQSWTLEEIPDPMYVKPATMYKDKFFMTYCGIGDLQIRDR